MTENQLVTIDNFKALTPAVIYQDGNIPKLTAEIRKQALANVPDISTDKGRKAIASNAHSVSRSKILIDVMGKELGAEYKTKLDAINKERKTMRDECDEIKIEARKPLTEWENYQKEIDLEAGKIVNELSELSNLSGEETLEELDVILNSVSDIDILPHLGEHCERLEGQKTSTIFALEEKIKSRTQYEKDQAELAQMRKEKEEREAKEASELKAKEEAEAKDKAEKERLSREEQIKKDAEEKANREAEEKVQAEKDKIEADKQEAIRLQKEAERREKELIEQREADIALAEKKERERFEAEQKKKEEQTKKENAKEEKRIANKKHRAKIELDSLTSLQSSGLSLAIAENVLARIVKGEIENISITY